MGGAGGGWGWGAGQHSQNSLYLPADHLFERVGGQGVGLAGVGGNTVRRVYTSLL